MSELRIKLETQQVGAEALEHWVLEHDEADQLRSVVVREGGGTGTMLRQQYYSYDAGGNRTGYQEGNSVRALAYNALNQIVPQSAIAPVRFEGTLDEPGTVSINNHSATLRTVLDENETPSFRFGADVPLASGVHQVTVEARDGSGNVTEQHYEVEVGALTGQAVPEYDARGNMKSNGRGHSYEWDAANRLLAIEYADGSRTEFEYDALSRRVREVEKDEEGEVIGEKRLLWVGLGIVQERDAQNAVVKRHAGNGVVLADDSKYYYTRDHLGSLRQVVDEGETVVESYSYDAYGVSVASAPGGPNGVRLADFRYTGHWYHEKSGLHLAPYRAYDANLGVWISEDPIGENGGINLYGYVSARVFTTVDDLGLAFPGEWFDTFNSGGADMSSAAKGYDWAKGMGVPKVGADLWSQSSAAAGMALANMESCQARGDQSGAKAFKDALIANLAAAAAAPRPEAMPVNFDLGYSYHSHNRRGVTAGLIFGESGLYVYSGPSLGSSGGGASLMITAPPQTGWSGLNVSAAYFYAAQYSPGSGCTGLGIGKPGLSVNKVYIQKIFPWP